MKILTAAEMGAADRATAALGTPIADLMENAGAAVARFCLRRYSGARRVVVLCGKGNNGGDGMVAARLLAHGGMRVSVLLLGRRRDLTGEPAGAFVELQAVAPAVEVTELLDEAGLADAVETLGAADLIVDAVVGTGFKPPLRGMPEMLQGILERSKTPVVAVDLPSGWDADSMELTAHGAFCADAVVTFTAPKLAHIFGHLTGSTFGPVVVAEIGSPVETVVSETGLHWAGAAKALAEKPRGVNSNKGKFGHVLVVGGSYGTAGAPSMTSLAALRTGAGLVTAAVPESILELVAGVAPELMLVPLKEGADGAVSRANLEPEALATMMKKISVVALGPGLSTRGDASAFARELVGKAVAGKDGRPLPMVIDADALNAFQGKAELLDGTGRTLVITPHPGEMGTLAGMTIPEVEADRIGLARRFATEHHLTLVLKGWRTLIAHPDGRIAVNTTGNPAMAKGGSGDILTGIVAAMLAQYAGSGEAKDVSRAVEAAVFLHGLAGDFAACAMDEHTVLATDTLGHLSDAFRYRVEDADGMVWLCGVHP